MTDNMADNEIIKALECCIHDDEGTKERPCQDCPLRRDDACSNSLRKHSLDLINRQKAEIDSLKKEVEILNSVYQRNTGLREKRIFDLMDELKTIKSEVVREFSVAVQDAFAEYSKIDEIPVWYVNEKILGVEEAKIKELVGDDK